MKYKQFIINNIDIIKKYDNKILSINKVKYEFIHFTPFLLIHYNF